MCLPIVAEVSALRDATQPPKGLAEATTKHIAFVDRRDWKGLHGRNRESKEA